MNENPQEALCLTISSKNDTLEFIKHNDLHYWVYINGMMSDVRIPRHIADEAVRDFEHKGNYHKLYMTFVFGKSMYNKAKTMGVFIDLSPESFI